MKITPTLPPDKRDGGGVSFWTPKWLNLVSSFSGAVHLGEKAEASVEVSRIYRPACLKTSLGNALCEAVCRMLWGLRVRDPRLPDYVFDDKLKLYRSTSTIK